MQRILSMDSDVFAIIKEFSENRGFWDAMPPLKLRSLPRVYFDLGGLWLGDGEQCSSIKLEGASSGGRLLDSMRVWSIVLLLLLLALPQTANAQANSTWSPLGSPNGGSGSWNTTDNSWFNGTVFLPWSNAPGASATFSGNTGVVTVDAVISAQNITFQTSGYTIAPGTGSLTLF
jgi:hypothetical protein